MADRFKLRRGPKNNIDLNVYELGYATDSDEERLYFNNGSMVPIPNNKDITDIKTELTETTNVTNKNKQDVSELKESVAGIIKTGVAKLVQYSYDIELSENTKKVNIPYERYSSVTDTLKVYVNGLAIQNDQYTITDPVENDGIVTNGYIILKIERPAGTIVRIEVWKNVPSGEEGEVSGNIIAKNSLPLNRIIGIKDMMNNKANITSTLTNKNVTNNTDFNDIVETGIYNIGNTKDMANNPNISWGILTVIRSNEYIRQEFTQLCLDQNYSGRTFVRARDDYNVWTDWKKIEFTNDSGWIGLPLYDETVQGSSGNMPMYRKIGNFLILRGRITNISITNKVLATLPTGYRPATTAVYITSIGSSGSTDSAKIAVITTGNIQLMHTASGSISSNKQIFLDGIIFVI